MWFTQLQRFPGVDFDVEQELREYRFEEENYFFDVRWRHCIFNIIYVKEFTQWTLVG